MKRAILAATVCLILHCLEAEAISKIYTGTPFPLNRIVNGIQYIESGKPFLDLTKGPIVAIIDYGDNSVRLICPAKGDPESLFYWFRVGDMVSVRIAGNLAWDQVVQSYTYTYTFYSETDSRTPIATIRMDEMYEYKEVLGPPAWMGFFNRQLGNHVWMQFNKDAYLMPGDSLSGFNYLSGGPPVIRTFFIEGDKVFIDMAGVDEFFTPSATEIMQEHQGIEGETVIPGPQPERIEGPEWVLDIASELGVLWGNGYIPEQYEKSIHDIIVNLHQDLRNLEKPTYDNWNPLIEKALSDLEPYQNLIEPEAYGFIVENLKYMQRHQDIVWFGKYPKIPK
jgi:hypothetical protein